MYIYNTTIRQFYACIKNHILGFGESPQSGASGGGPCNFIYLFFAYKNRAFKMLGFICLCAYVFRGCDIFHLLIFPVH